MIPEQTLLNYPLFGDNATKVEPDNNKKSNGWQQADVVPAEWMNWAWYHNSKGIKDLNDGVSSMEKEINAVLSAAEISPSESTNNQLLTSIMKVIHPVGSLYWTSKAPNDGGDPNTLFGGAWVQIKDKFILAAGDTYTNGATGGAATVTLTTDNMPSHTHTGTTNGNTTGITATHDHIHSNPTTIAMGTGVATAVYNYPVFAIGASGVGWREDAQIAVSCTGARNPQTQASMPEVQVTDPGHAHSFTTNSSGSGAAHNNMPPYIVKYCWERTA